MRLYGQTLKPDQVDPQEAAKYEDDAGRYWDLFYKRNSDKFFKDRHYFDKEWPQLTQGQITVLEVGCGAGNSVFPLLEINPRSYVYACDFSPRAVELVKAHPAYAGTGRATVFVADITQHEGSGALSQQLPGPVVDFCSMVFVLSAVAPHKMRQAVRNVASVLKSGSGRVLFRDYADGDLAQTRLQDSQGVKHIRGNFYARGDGTCCYYFGQDELSSLFAAEGFVCESTLIHARTIENRKTGVKMARRWIQAVFRYDPVQQPPQPLPVVEVPSQQQQDHYQHQQQQQQQQVSPAESSVEGQQCNGDRLLSSRSSNGSDSCTRVDCAGKTWLLPSHFAAAQSSSNSSSSVSELYQSICCIAESLASLVQQQQVQVLGRCLLVAPPWLCIQQQQQQQQQQLPQGPGVGGSLQQQWLQFQLQLVAAPGVVVPQAYCLAQHSNCSGGADNSSSSSSSSSSAEGAAQLEGAGAALLALAAVWLGARRVYVCLPDNSLEPAAAAEAAAATAAEPLQQQPGHVQQSAVRCPEVGARLASVYVEAFHAVLGLNECSVVVERIRPKRWGQGDLRRAEVLQREVVAALSKGLPACNGLVFVARAAGVPSSSSGHGSSSPSNSGCDAGVNSRAHQGAQRLVDAVFHASQVTVRGPVQVLLRC